MSRSVATGAPQCAHPHWRGPLPKHGDPFRIRLRPRATAPVCGCPVVEHFELVHSAQSPSDNRLPQVIQSIPTLRDLWQQVTVDAIQIGKSGVLVRGGCEGLLYVLVPVLSFTEHVRPRTDIDTEFGCYQGTAVRVPGRLQFTSDVVVVLIPNQPEVPGDVQLVELLVLRDCYCVCLDLVELAFAERHRRPLQLHHEILTTLRVGRRASR